MKLYSINTKNKYSQVLIFTSKKAATDWAKRATNWTDEQIESEIRTSERNWQGHFDIFPLH